MKQHTKRGEKMARLGDICKKASSSVAQKDLETCEGQYPIYGASGLIKYVDFYHQEKPYVAVVKDGAGVGRVMQLPAKSSIIGTMQYIIPNDGVNVSYLAYALEHMNLAKYYTGATIPHIYFKDYCNEAMPDHGKDEQKYIAEILDKVNSLVVLRKQQLTKLDELIKSRFIELFGTKESPKCDVVKLSSLVKYQQGTQVDMDKQFAQCTDGMTRFLRIIDYTQGNQEPRYVENKGTYVYADTVCIVRYGTVGFVCKGYEGILANNLFKLDLTTDKMDNDFLYCVLKYGTFENDIKALSNGATMPALSFKIMDTIDILLPSIEKQMEYTTFVEQTDKSKLAIQQSLEKLETLKKALMQQYFG